MPQLIIKLDGINARLDTADEVSQIEHTVRGTIQKFIMGGGRTDKINRT